MRKFTKEEMDAINGEVAKEKPIEGGSFKEAAAESSGNALDTLAKAKEYGEEAGNIVGSGGQAIADFAAGIPNMMGIDKLFGNKKKPFKIPVEEKLGTKRNEAGYIGGGILNPLDPTAKLKIAKAIGGAAPGLLKKILGGAAEGAVRGAGTTAAIGATNRKEGEESNVLQNLMSGGSVGGAIGGSIPGGAAIYKTGKEFLNKAPEAAVRKVANMLLTRLNKRNEIAPNMTRSPKQVSDMQDMLPKDLRFNIGEIVKDPGAKKFYTSALGKVPWSGVKKEEAKALDYSVKQTNDLMSGLLGQTHPTDALKGVEGGVKRLSKERVAEADKLYSGVRNGADEYGFRLKEAPNTAHTAEKYLDENGKAYAKFLNSKDEEILKNWAKAKKQQKTGNAAIDELIQKESSGIKLSDFEQKRLNSAKIQMPELGKSSLTPKTFEEARKERKYFSDEARKARLDKDYTRAKIMDDMKRSVGKDIEKTLKNDKKYELYKGFQNAEKYYATKVAPVRKETDIMQIVNGKAKHSSIPQTLLNDKNKEVLNSLTKEEKNLIGYSLLKSSLKAEDFGRKASPLGFNQRLQSIPDEVQKKIFTPEQRKAFGQQNIVARATEEGAKSAGIHPTGVQAAELGAVLTWLKNLGTGIPASIAGNKVGRIMNSPVVRKAYASGEKIKKGSELDKELIQDILSSKKKHGGLLGKAQKALHDLLNSKTAKNIPASAKKAEKGIYYQMGTEKKEEEK